MGLPPWKEGNRTLSVRGQSHSEHRSLDSVYAIEMQGRVLFRFQRIASGQHSPRLPGSTKREAVH